MTDCCTIDAILVGRSVLRGPELLRGQAFDEWFEIASYSWLVRSPAGIALIDTGMTPDAKWWDDRAKKIRGQDAYWEVTADADPTAALGRLGVSREDVDHIVLTSFAPYTASNAHCFPNARIHVARRGLAEYREPRYPSLRPPLPPEASLILDHDPEARLAPFDDEVGVMPGLRLRVVGGHHIESLTVLIRTVRGLIAIPEPIFTEANLVAERALGLSDDLYAWLDLLAWLSSLGAEVVPIHEPNLILRFPNGRIA